MSAILSGNITPRRQLALVAVAAVAIAAVLTVVYFTVIRTPYGVLFTDLRPADASAIITELDKKKVPYRITDGGATILAPANVIDVTRLNVLNADLPIHGTVGFELFNRSDMGLTEFAQKINFQRALQGELARTIMAMDTVDTARIHLSLAEPTVFRADQRPPKASVAVSPRRGMQVSADTVRGIQRLVAAAVPDLEVASVVVLDQHGAVISAEAAPMTPPARVQEQLGLEQYHAARIRQAIEAAYPESGAEVTVTANLDADRGSGALGGRSYPIHVQVLLPEGATQQRQEQIRDLVNQAILINASLGDSVAISVAPAPGAPAAVASVQPAQPRAERSFNPGPVAALGFILATLLGLAAVLAFGPRLFGRRRITAPHRLTPEQRSDYVRRLSVLLDKGEADAAPPL